MSPVNVVSDGPEEELAYLLSAHTPSDIGWDLEACLFCSQINKEEVAGIVPTDFWIDLDIV